MLGYAGGLTNALASTLTQNMDHVYSSALATLTNDRGFNLATMNNFKFNEDLFAPG